MTEEFCKSINHKFSSNRAKTLAWMENSLKNVYTTPWADWIKELTELLKNSEESKQKEFFNKVNSITDITKLSFFSSMFHHLLKFQLSNLRWGHKLRCCSKCFLCGNRCVLEIGHSGFHSTYHLFPGFIGKRSRRSEDLILVPCYDYVQTMDMVNYFHWKQVGDQNENTQIMNHAWELVEDKIHSQFGY
jgi:hypothetical protein